MNFNKFFVIISFLLVLSSCGGTEEETTSTTTSDETDQVIGNPDIIENECIRESAEDFSSFLGIDYSMGKSEVKEVLGNPSVTEMTNDGHAIIYYYDTEENSEVAVFINESDDQVETIRIQFADLEDKYIDQSIENTSRLFNIEACDQQFFGLGSEELGEILGEPSNSSYNYEIDPSPVFIQEYFSQDKKYQANFYFYGSQNERCTKISVDWYY